MEKKFIELFKEVLEIEDKEISLNDNFRDYDEWDSLTFLSLISMIDDEFGVVIETDEFNEITSLKKLIEEVKSRSSN